LLANECVDYKSRLLAVNKALYECGMPRLDSKNPFDWLFIHALESDELESETMSKMIKIIFDTEVE
jgi:hypothetical protein